MAMEDPNRKRTKHKMRLIEKTITENVGQSKLWYREKLESLPTKIRAPKILEGSLRLVKAGLVFGSGLKL